MLLDKESTRCVPISNQDKILGYVSNNNNFVPLNFNSFVQVYILVYKKNIQTQPLYAATNAKELFL